MSKIERGGNIRKSLFKQFTKLFSKKQSSATLTEKEMKITFNEYCAFHQPTWVCEESV